MIPANVEIHGSVFSLVAPPENTPELLEQARLFYSDPINMTFLPFFCFEWTEQQVIERRNMQKDLHLNHKALNFDMISRENNQLIGVCGFRMVDLEKSEAEFGIILHHTHWGKRIAKEAHKLFINYVFEKLNLQFVYALTSPENLPMRKFFEKFQIPFLGEQSIITGATWCKYGIKKDEWETLKKNFD